MSFKFVIMSLLAFAFMSDAIANERSPQDKRGPILDAIIVAIETRDQQAFSEIAGEFAIQELPSDDTRGYRRIYRFNEFVELLEGCTVDAAYEPNDKVRIVRKNTKSFGNGVISWTCKGRKSPMNECHDVYYIAALRQYIGDKTYHYLHFDESSRYSDGRCGKRDFSKMRPVPPRPIKEVD